MRIFQINSSHGGVPKLAIQSDLVGELGLSTDSQRNRRHHGGPDRALCLFSLEAILALQDEGNPIYPGATGENITITGEDYATLIPGTILRLGDQVVVEITSYTVPCKIIGEAFRDQDFNRISQKSYPGWSRLYARVVQGGTITVGESIEVVGRSNQETVGSFSET